MSSDTPLKDALSSLSEPTNTFSAGITGTKDEGVGGRVEISKDLGHGRELEAEASISQKKGWSFGAFYKRVWGSGK